MNQQSENIFPMMELPDGIMGQIVTILHEPREILNLALTCQRLGNICEGVARAFIDGATDKERSNLPQINLPTTHDLRSPYRSSSFGNWGLISKYQQILKHRESLKFDQIVGGAEYSDPNDMSRIAVNGEGFGVSNRIMRSGVHRATFEFSGQGGVYVHVGIARPMDYQRIALHGYQYTYPSSEPVRKKYPSAWRDEVIINIVQHSSSGNTWLYKGLEAITINENVDFPFSNGDRIGLVLNLDAGTLSMHKNGIYVGELCSGLEGEYLWVGCIVGVPQCTNISISDWE
mmetsp:Transcript_9756/g.23871  ORF Transcript_9756/g.23871 Transcript_9756/m.23871 type:complete len:288 (+) Transcript_9756:193-1056(+)